MRSGTRVRLIEGYASDEDGRVDYDSPHLSSDVGTIISETEREVIAWHNVSELVIRWDSGKLQTVPIDDINLQDVTPRLFVNVYLYDRAYGGPEEGGWWFDTFTPEDDMCRIAETEEEAEELLKELEVLVSKDNENRRPVSSVLSEGIYEVKLEAFPPEHSPKQKPHYC